MQSRYKVKGMLLIMIIFVLVFINSKISYAKLGNSLNKGDYIKFGSYYGEQILWRVIKDDDENHRVMLISDRIIMFKSFDSTSSLGDNRWNESNIRDWLNSKSVPKLSDDEWTDSSPYNPTSNNYIDEAGFLSNFLDEERNVIVKMNDDGEQNQEGN